MKKVLQFILVLVIANGITGCATPYMIDRGRDAADIFTATVGVGIGTKARVGPVRAGLYAGADMAGLRGGEGIVDMMPSRMDYVPGASELELSLVSVECFMPSKAIDSIRRNKQFLSYGMCSLSKAFEGKFHYYTQIEAAVGLGPAIRLGFNPIELLDFILGWTTIDIFNDDLERMKKKEEKSKQGLESDPQ